MTNYPMFKMFSLLEDVPTYASNTTSEEANMLIKRFNEIDPQKITSLSRELACSIAYQQDDQ